MAKKNKMFEYEFFPVVDGVVCGQRINKNIEPILKEITDDAWCDFGDVYKKWLKISNYLVLIKINNEYVAFDLKGRLKDKDLIFVSSMVKKKYQGEGIIARASKIILSQHLKYIFSKGIKASLSILVSPIYFVFRTPNPRLYYSVRRFSPFPAIFKKRSCTKKELDMAMNIVNMLSPDCEFDKDSFVIRGGLKNHALYYSEKNYPKSKNEKINNYFETAIDYKNNKGNLQVIVGRISLWSLIK